MGYPLGRLGWVGPLWFILVYFLKSEDWFIFLSQDLFLSYPNLLTKKIPPGKARQDSYSCEMSGLSVLREKPTSGDIMRCIYCSAIRAEDQRQREPYQLR